MVNAVVDLRLSLKTGNFLKKQTVTGFLETTLLHAVGFFVSDTFKPGARVKLYNIQDTENQFRKFLKSYVHCFFPKSRNMIIKFTYGDE